MLYGKRETKPSPSIFLHVYMRVCARTYLGMWCETKGLCRPVDFNLLSSSSQCDWHELRPALLQNCLDHIHYLFYQIQIIFLSVHQIQMTSLQQDKHTGIKRKMRWGVCCCKWGSYAFPSSTAHRSSNSSKNHDFVGWFSNLTSSLYVEDWRSIVFSINLPFDLVLE